MTHLVISDPHVGAGQNLRRFDWLSRLIADVKPDRVICIGDMATLDSCSGHEKPGTLGHVALPRLRDEALAVQDAQDRMFRRTKVASTVMVMGNHEDRYDRWLNGNPHQADAMPSLADLLQYTRHWRQIVPFKSHAVIDGIAYTHVPHTSMGRPIGGKTKTSRCANECSRPLIFGHGHDLQVHTAGDILGGPAKRFAMSAPAYQDDGNVEKYAQGSQTGWSYGVVVVKPQGDDRIPSFEYISMRDIEEEYE